MDKNTSSLENLLHCSSVKGKNDYLKKLNKYEFYAGQGVRERRLL